MLIAPWRVRFRDTLKAQLKVIFVALIMRTYSSLKTPPAMRTRYRLASRATRASQGARSRWTTALKFAEQILHGDPFREDVHRLIMKIHAAQGKRAAVVEQFEIHDCHFAGPRNYEDKGQFCRLDMVKVEKRAVMRGSEAIDNSDEAIPSAAADDEPDLFDD